jgi:hypothetical protein
MKNTIDRYEVSSAVPVKYPDGQVVSKLVLNSTTIDNGYTEIEFPYHPDYQAANITAEIVGNDSVSNGDVEIKFYNVDNLFALDSARICPFCGGILLSLFETTNSAVYCFNPFCFVDIQTQFCYTIRRLGLSLSEEEIRCCLRLIECMSVRSPNLLNLYDILANINTNTYNLRMSESTVMYSLLCKFKQFINNCTVSKFLRLVNIPETFDEDIHGLDICFDNVEDFYFEMMNYRSMGSRLPLYNSNLMNLIYSNLQVNKYFVELFFNYRKEINNHPNV